MQSSSKGLIRLTLYTCASRTFLFRNEILRSFVAMNHTSQYNFYVISWLIIISYIFNNEL